MMNFDHKSVDQMDQLSSPESFYGMTSSDNMDSKRKASKPAMEKRRRARINASLLELKSLLLQAVKDESCHHSKMEKADILEMAVKHLRQLQRQQFAVAAATNPSVVNKYRLGYNECANEVTRYLGNVEGVSVDARARLLRHLSACLGDNTRVKRARNNVIPVMTNNGVVFQNNDLQTRDLNNNTGAVILNNNNVMRANSTNNNVLQTAKLIDSNGAEITVLIGLPSTQGLMTSQVPVQNMSSDSILQALSMGQNKTVNQSVHSTSQTIKSTSMTSQSTTTSLPNMLTSAPSIMTSQSPIDGKEKTYQEVGVWQEDVWRPW